MSFDSARGVLKDHLFHRATLAREKAANLEFERNRRPGGIADDSDFGENGNIAEARPIQSQYWMNSQDSPSSCSGSAASRTSRATCRL